jgi:hypothetical protein
MVIVIDDGVTIFGKHDVKLNAMGAALDTFFKG